MAIREGKSAIPRPPSGQNPVLVYDNPLLDPPKDGKINFEFSPFEMRNSAPFGELLNFKLFNNSPELGSSMTSSILSLSMTGAILRPSPILFWIGRLARLNFESSPASATTSLIISI